MSSAGQKRGRIIIFGQDQALLESRAQLIESLGFSTDRPSSLEEYRHFTSTKTPYMLAVLCQSLSPEQRASAEEALAGGKVVVPVYDLKASVAPLTFLREIERLAEVSQKFR
jgi:hypothetical protein